MGEWFWTRLVVRERDVTPEVRAVLEAEGPYDEGPEAENGFVEVVGYEQKWGEFPGLEAKLVALGVPFDRYSDCEPALERRFRPAQDGRPAVDVEVALIDGEPFVLLGKLRELLESCRDYASLRGELSRLIEEREPVPPLEPPGPASPDDQPGEL